MKKQLLVTAIITIEGDNLTKNLIKLILVKIKQYYILNCLIIMLNCNKGVNNTMQVIKQIMRQSNGTVYKI